MQNNNFQQRIVVLLSNLYLDPNNYRFIDSPNYIMVNDHNITNDNIQKRTYNFIVGEKNSGIEDLLKSFKTNGYLEVDQIQVEEIPNLNGHYRVLEGNRRIATLKKLYDDYTKLSLEMGKLDVSIFNAVPVTLVQQQKKGEHEMIMALKHISGNKKWATLNQAQLLYDLIYKYGWTETEVIESIGITLQKLRRDLRTLSLIESYKKSDFGDKFETEMFNIFKEIISSTAIKQWLSWDDTTYKPTNIQNTERLFSWLSPIEEEKQDEDGKIIEKQDKILKQGDDIRALSEIISDSAALDFMQKERSLIKAYSISTVLSNEKFKNILKIVAQQIEDAKYYSSHADKEDKNKILSIKNQLDSILVASGGLGLISGQIPAQILNPFKTKQLKNITLEKYKRFKLNLEVGPFNRINIFAGNNNIGKTSLLEAIYLLCSLNDYQGLYNVYQRRGKFTNGLPSEWFNNVIPSEVFVTGNFDEYTCGLNIKKTYDVEDIETNKAQYLSTLEFNSNFRGNKYTSKIKIKSGNSNPESFYSQIFHLCNVIYSNPFTLTDRNSLELYHSLAVDKGATAKIIKFMQEFVDNNIIDIEKSGVGNDFRFMVTYKNADRPIDLTEFGDGIQRVYQISLMIIAAENGIMCIDEIENAIHHALLVEFTKFIQEMAQEYNVQIFATTHSAECVKAFFENEFNNEDITGFRLIQTPEGISFQKAIGLNLEKQLYHFSLDLRG